MKLGEFDRSGRRRPTDSDREEFVLPADQVIAAIGQNFDAGSVLDQDLMLKRDGYLSVNPVTMQSSVDWIFAGGDVFTGPASVVEAVGAGEKAAAGIDEMLTGKNHAFWREEKPNPTAFDPDAEPSTDPREKQPLIPVERRRENFDEVELPWNEPTAVRQARRCLRCDYREEQHTW
jgi:NADH-quinone oxidoreductase subunit F